MKKRLIYVGYGVMIISSVACLIIMFLLIHYFELVERCHYDYQDRFGQTIIGLVGIALSGWFSYYLYRRKCEKTIAKVFRNIFFVLCYFAALSVSVGGAIILGLNAHGLKEYADEVMEEKREKEKLEDVLRGDDMIAAEQVMWDAYNSETLNYINNIEEFLRRWVEKGSNVAELLLGEYYFDKKGNMEHAFYWWSRAAEHGNSYAYIRMGQCYEKRIGINTLQKNRQIAFDWYQKAALAGRSKGYLSMGNILLESNQIDEAKECWKKAAEMGNVDARSALEKVYSTDVQPGARKANP